MISNPLKQRARKHRKVRELELEPLLWACLATGHLNQAGALRIGCSLHSCSIHSDTLAKDEKPEGGEEKEIGEEEEEIKGVNS